MIDEVKVIGQISDVGLQINAEITDNATEIQTTIEDVGLHVTSTIIGTGPQGPPGPPGNADLLDYNIMFNKPKIELVELVGNKSFEELGITAMETADIDNLL